MKIKRTIAILEMELPLPSGSSAIGTLFTVHRQTRLGSSRASWLSSCLTERLRGRMAGWLGWVPVEGEFLGDEVAGHLSGLTTIL